MPGNDHYQTWHGDVAKGRLVGISVNLESDPTAAGGIEIRHQGSTVHRAVPGFGDAVLFRIAPDLRHRGLPPAGAVPRCSFSGWFVAGKDYRRRLGVRQTLDEWLAQAAVGPLGARPNDATRVSC